MIPSHGDFTVGWVTAIRKEYTAARQVLDEEFDTTNFVLPRGDRNTYTYGRIGSHYVLITCLENAQCGINSASDAADDMRSSFPMIRLLLIVGIAGGIPTLGNDIRLGDIVVGTEIIRYRSTATGEFERSGHVEPAGRALFTGTQGLAVQLDEGLDLYNLLEKTFTKTQKIKDDYQKPQECIDHLWIADYEHDSSQCLSSVDERKLVSRPKRPDYDRIKVHSGKIGSTDKLTNNAGVRDNIGKKFGVLCSKEEPASAENKFPCLHIRGICNYADSHSNHAWKGYAAASASVYAKKLLQTIAPEEVWRMNISIDIKNLQQFVEYLVYEVSQATNISARLAEQKTRLMTTSRALRGVKTGVELLVQLSQEAVSDSQQQLIDAQIMRDRWDALAASQGDLRKALNTLGMHIKNLQKSVSSKDSKLECDRLHLRVQMSAAALQDLSNMIKPFFNNVTNFHDQEDMTPSDVTSIAASESTRKSSNLTQLSGRFSDLSTKAFTKPERHSSKLSISESSESKDTDEIGLSADASVHRKGHRWSNLFRKEDHKQEETRIESPYSEGERTKGLGVGWRYSFQTMKGNMSRSDVSIFQEQRSLERPTEKSFTPISSDRNTSRHTTSKELVRSDSPQELPVSAF
ncbi:uncharacterized protein N7484_004664 [Penicillium longicatenatum]|uniref:uncharacterized protein n=1 Tax=Penicillium longicatenatum TaxID=1561947 RepID=UPI002547E36B|nr:uncharacterized protein N7484_004664 [Penicillium longicatenatum]KAJ5650941.1 hypothetical protein N7484_004664 [Penicillium longicatenatum]